MQLYKVRKKYERAIAEGERILKRSALTHAFEAKVHLELAICLDLLGRAAEAQAHRQTADDCLDGCPEGMLGWKVQGEILETQRRFAEAAAAYERALDACPADSGDARDELLIRLGLATFNAGRPDETIEWAERAIAEEVSPKRLYSAHRLAAIATINLERPDDSLYHRRRAYELALEGGSAQEIAESLALIGEIYELRSEFDLADSYCQQAQRLCPDDAHLAFMIQAIILRARGRFDEAVQRMEQAIRVGVLASAFHERRRAAAFKTWLAVYKADAGRLAEAWPDLRDATAELQDDPKLSLTCEAAWIFLLAHQGDRDEVLERATSILSRIDSLAPDLAFRRDALELVGEALFHVGEHDRSESCWTYFLMGTPLPIGEPRAYYYLGMCRLHCGDRPGAARAFRRATSRGIDSHFARLAERQLGDEI